MTDKHPYMSGSGGLVQAVGHLRKAFPAQVSAETLKKLAIAPNNETYVLNILRFIKVLDEEGKKTSEAVSVFTKHDDEEFQKGFAGMVEAAYTDLFTLHGGGAWTLPSDKLISYFRSTDHTSAVVGQRQAGTFQALAGLSGHGEAPTARAPASARRFDKQAAKPALGRKVAAAPPSDIHPPVKPPSSAAAVGLTVRIEINLPMAPDQETYDRIFKSIRENLLNGE